MIKNLLQRYLKKIGVTEFSQLTEEEKETYRKWDEILSTRKLTDDDVAVFLNTELEDTLQKLDPASPPRVDCFLKMKIEFIRKVKMFLRTPEIEKQVLEQNLHQLQ